MKTKRIGVIGGGTAGFISALILKSRYPDVQVDIICSSKIGIIGVGEGSTEHWNEFLKYIGVSWRSVITRCDATFKAGIMFKGWAEQDYLHSTNPDFEPKSGQYNYVYGKQISEGHPEKTLTPNLVWDNLIDNRYLEDKDPPFNQFHFNTQKLNTFLHDVAELKGIPVIDDEITDVKLNINGEIGSVVGTSQEYTYDFYIDCTGFKKLLISKLGGKWNSYSKYLKMNSAIVFPTEAQTEYNIYTTAQAMDYGWMFTIPVWGRTGNGYIFDSNYINADAAKQEVESFLGHPITIGKHITFDPGAIDKSWIKNCVAVGLSGNFIEPLEATSIGTSIQQAFLLMHRLPNYDEKTIEQYNSAVTDIMENIRDFVILHYQTKKDNSQFWKDVKTLELPESLKIKLERWQKNLPIEEDFCRASKYILFREVNFTQVLHGLNLFNRENIAVEYNAQRKEIKELASKALIDIELYEQSLTTISHKRFIELIRSGV
jgi:flavin-dependent dehydrogenase